MDFVALFGVKIQDLKTFRNYSVRTAYFLYMRAFSRGNFLVTNACSHSFRLLFPTGLSEKWSLDHGELCCYCRREFLLHTVQC